MTPRLTLIILLSVVLGIGLTPSVPAAAVPTTGEPLYDSTSMYPRVIRLQHGDAKGQILASATTFTERGGEVAIFRSTDDGKSFQHVTLIPAAQGFGKPGLCCGSIYELPQDAAGMPAGTVLWAGTMGQEARPMRTGLDVWRSDDAGSTWRRLGTIMTSPHDGGTWEPEFSVDRKGRLAVYFAEETATAPRDQRLARMTTDDGVTWTDKRYVVDSEPGAGRPGMPNVRRLPNGSYLMVYEICGVPGSQYDCAVYTRSSRDGIHWGDPLGGHRRVVAESGNYFVAAPTFTWAPDGTRDGRLILVGQQLKNPDGTPAAGNGSTLFVSDGHPAKPWREVTAPVAVPDPFRHPCPNYSSTLLPVGRGEILEIATDFAENQCRAFFGTATVA
ncbi:sialidase family protein [Microlunatus parietis]|uniref:BNR repeat-like domain-containing protein n=1 Tax=Microlunatus parietis TaxID=682979 RepID=A0A7Y9I9H3_9ACTN|nr:sialidase family protein [Microlunatus parietis]NYE72783.1 hypothetical protein [Microlunatus parietis]